MDTKQPKQLTEVRVDPALVKFWDTTVGKSLKAAIYLAVSALVSALIAAIADNPVLFGIFTPIVNVILVVVKNFFDPHVRNI